jgi:hypothetical protein
VKRIPSAVKNPTCIVWTVQEWRESRALGSRNPGDWLEAGGGR